MRAWNNIAVPVHDAWQPAPLKHFLNRARWTHAVAFHTSTLNTGGTFLPHSGRPWGAGYLGATSAKPSALTIIPRPPHNIRISNLAQDTPGWIWSGSFRRVMKRLTTTFWVPQFAGQNQPASNETPASCWATSATHLPVQRCTEHLNIPIRLWPAMPGGRSIRCSRYSFYQWFHDQAGARSKLITDLH